MTYLWALTFALMFFYLMINLYNIFQNIQHAFFFHNCWQTLFYDNAKFTLNYPFLFSHVIASVISVAMFYLMQDFVVTLIPKLFDYFPKWKAQMGNGLETLILPSPYQASYFWNCGRSPSSISAALLYARLFVIPQPNCQAADLMVFKLNCNTLNSILCSLTPDQRDVLVSISSLAKRILFDGFLSAGFGFIMSLYKTLELPLYNIFHL